MQRHHCSGSDLLLGRATVAGSEFALLLIGFLIGLAAGAGVMVLVRRRRGSYTLPTTAAQHAEVQPSSTLCAPVNFSSLSPFACVHPLDEDCLSGCQAPSVHSSCLCVISM